MSKDIADYVKPIVSSTTYCILVEDGFSHREAMTFTKSMVDEYMNGQRNSGQVWEKSLTDRQRIFIAEHEPANLDLLDMLTQQTGREFIRDTLLATNENPYYAKLKAALDARNGCTGNPIGRPRGRGDVPTITTTKPAEVVVEEEQQPKQQTLLGSVVDSVWNAYVKAYRERYSVGPTGVPPKKRIEVRILEQTEHLTMEALLPVAARTIKAVQYYVNGHDHKQYRVDLDWMLKTGWLYESCMQHAATWNAKLATLTVAGLSVDEAKRAQRRGEAGNNEESPAAYQEKHVMPIFKKVQKHPNTPKDWKNATALDILFKSNARPTIPDLDGAREFIIASAKEYGIVL